MLFGVPIDPLLCLALVGGMLGLLCGAHAWTEGRRFERLYGGHRRRPVPSRRQGNRDILHFRPAR